MTAPLWRIGLLGRLCLERNQELVTHFRTQKAGALLAYLAYYMRQSHPREALVERFWPDSAPEAARNNFRVALSLIRHRLEPSGVAPGTVLLADRAHIQIHPAACTTDVAEFDTALRSAQLATADEDRATFFTRAVELYTGELLPGYDDAWIREERQRLSDLYVGALRHLIRFLAQNREFERAVGFARRAISVDPLCEESHRHLMRLYGAVGRPAAALQQYGELQRILRAELGVEPSRAMRDLARQFVSVVGEEAVASPVPAPGSHSAATALTHCPDMPPNLPPAWNRFFGREEELRLLRSLLTSGSVRLVTLTGPGGSGKTRLAIEAARLLNESCAMPVWFVSLANVSQSDQISTAILQALKVTPAPNTEPLAQVVSLLTPRPGTPSPLLILDNFEHLVEEGALVVHTLLEKEPNLTCLITSRQRLQIAGEQEFVLLPLPTPSAPSSPEALMEFASVQLFVARAQTVRLGFRLTASNAPNVATLCERLDGLPLAIELAAASVDVLTPAQMLTRLSNRFAWLVGQRKDLSPRHQTLRDTLAWSYHLLSPRAQRFFASLSVFRGGWTSEAAADVIPEEKKEPCDPEAFDTVARLRKLRDRSLVVAVEMQDEMRFRMLETIREYAAQQIEESERDTIAQRHASYFMQLAKLAHPHLTGPDQARWLDRLEAEHENLRAALEWAHSQADAAETEVSLAGDLWRFWEIRGHIREGRTRLAAALSRPTARNPVRTRALHGAAALAGIERDYAQANAYMEECMAIYQEVGDAPAFAGAKINQAIIAKHQGQYPLAQQLLQESLATWRELGKKERIAVCLLNLGNLAFHLGDYSVARLYYDESLGMHRELGNDRFVANTLMSLGLIAFHEEHLSAASALAEESLRLNRRLGDRRAIAIGLMNVGAVSFALGDAARGCSACKEGLAVFQELGDSTGVASFLEAMSGGAWSQGQPERSVCLAAAAQALRKSLGAPLAPNQEAEQEGYLSLARAALNEQACADAVAHGRAMTPDQATAYALQMVREE